MDSPHLPEAARQIIREGHTVLFVSIASVWEIAIKASIGKLDAPNDLEQQLIKGHMQTLPISIEHALFSRKLPRHHDDPFDRMLVAQAQQEGVTLLTHDRRLKAYGEHIRVL